MSSDCVVLLLYFIIIIAVCAWATCHWGYLFKDCGVNIFPNFPSIVFRMETIEGKFGSLFVLAFS